MILSDTTILRRLTSAEVTLAIDTIKDKNVQIQPASVDLRLAAYFIRVRKTHGGVIDLLKPEQEVDRVTADGSFIIEPGEFVLGATQERVRMPNDLVGRVDGRSSLGRLGLVVHVTAGFIDQGFAGRITLELMNFNPNPLRLHVGMRICQISFHTLSEEVTRPYGPERGSKYVGAYAEGVTASRLGEDSTK